MDIIGRSYMLITSGSQRVKRLMIERMMTMMLNCFIFLSCSMGRQMTTKL